jgi:hypothetical protein
MSNVLGNLFGDIAAAIRAKTGDVGKMKPAEFSAKIASIEKGMDTTQIDSILDEINGEPIGEIIVSQGFCGDDARYTLKDSGTLAITGTGEMTSAPWTNVVGYETLIKKATIADGITSVCQQAFQSCIAMTSVTLSNTLETIGVAAFNGSSIKKVIIPASVTRIWALAFGNCESLVSAEFEDRTGWEVRKTTGELIVAFTSDDLLLSPVAAQHLRDHVYNVWHKT